AQDALLLRLATAEKAAGRPAAEHMAMLAERFAALRDRGDVVHRREEARFELLRGNATRALQLARENWDVQREPADVRVLLEAARAAGDPRAAEPVVRFLEESGLEPPKIKEVVTALHARRS